MQCIFVLISFALFANNIVHSENCGTVSQGSHYPTLIPFHGFKSDEVISTGVRFMNSSSEYLFPPTDEQGQRCSVSWNKLWGACRCGYLTSNHKDSDRFVFRRARSCLVFEGGRVVREIPSCPEAGLIEVAAYAYDNGDKPTEHPDRLLKEFQTKLRINQLYKVTLTFQETQTIYQIFDHANQLLETQTIQHRSCSNYKQGMMQDLYFGGVCPAPQDVSVCYDKI